MRRSVLMLVAIVGVFLTPMTTGFADSPSGRYAVVSEEVSFSSSDSNGGGFTVQLLNLTEKAASVTAAPADTTRKECKAAAAPGTIAPSGVTTVTVTLTGCALPDKGGYGVILAVGGDPLPAISVAPMSKTSSPDWALFWAFPIALLGAVLVLFASAMTMPKDHRAARNRLFRWLRRRMGRPRWWFRHHLALGKGWSLKDSWASNVTVIAAGFAAVFGSSDVLKAILGKDTDPVFALTTVSAAVAVAVVGAAPLVVSAFQDEDHVTPFALLVGAALTLGATAGELSVICLATRHLALGGLQHVLWPVGLIGGGAILVLYAFKAMRSSLRIHHVKPKSSRPTPGPRVAADDAEHNALLLLHNMLPENVDPVAMIAASYGDQVRVETPAGRQSAIF